MLKNRAKSHSERIFEKTKGNPIILKNIKTITSTNKLIHIYSILQFYEI